MNTDTQIKELERDLAQSKEANAGLMRACDKLERQLADKRSQINRLINVIKSRDTDKVYTDKKCNELRDEVVATRDQRDALAEALETVLDEVRNDYMACKDEVKAALAAVKGGSHE
jgi:septal ring factor EnvC (AmiA/AmiB activator)